MFIENVPNVYISDPSQFKVGMALWVVGQGGVTEVYAPSFIGTYVGLREDDATFFDYEYEFYGEKRTTSASMRDKHVLPQMYNNWYLTSNKEDAEIIFNFMTEVWASDPAWEEERLHKLNESRIFDSWIDDYDPEDYRDYEEAA